jgi:hypothetical protein
MIADTDRQTSTASTDIASIVADPAAEIEFANPLEGERRARRRGV